MDMEPQSGPLPQPRYKILLKGHQGPVRLIAGGVPTEIARGDGTSVGSRCARAAAYFKVNVKDKKPYLDATAEGWSAETVMRFGKQLSVPQNRRPWREFLERRMDDGDTHIHLRCAVDQIEFAMEASPDVPLDAEDPVLIGYAAHGSYQERIAETVQRLRHVADTLDTLHAEPAAFASWVFHRVAGHLDAIFAAFSEEIGALAGEKRVPFVNRVEEFLDCAWDWCIALCGGTKPKDYFDRVLARVRKCVPEGWTLDRKGMLRHYRIFAEDSEGKRTTEVERAIDQHQKLENVEAGIAPLVLPIQARRDLCRDHPGLADALEDSFGFLLRKHRGQIVALVHQGPSDKFRWTYWDEPLIVGVLLEIYARMLERSDLTPTCSEESRRAILEEIERAVRS